MREITNQVMLITYADSMGGNLRELYDILNEYFSGVIGGVHILPFYPSSGDRGFSVIRYDKVDPAFGSWRDIREFSDRYCLMVDFMINHISIRSEEFLDYIRNGDESPFRDMFIDWNRFWPNGKPSQEEMDKLYRRKLQGPYREFQKADGKTVRLWNTFFEEQVDINPWAPATQAYFQRNLSLLSRYASVVRFDAVAYASKRPGTNCFFIEPEIWDVLEIGTKPLREQGVQMLPEVHGSYEYQLKMASRGYWVYDFALPMLLLHGLMTGRADRLIHWLKICPRKQFTTLDTHDGIGVVDVEGLLEDKEIEYVQSRVNRKIVKLRKYYRTDESMIKTSEKEARQYQLMCSFYSALGGDDAAYLLARVVQLFAPGIPQVYYVGLLAGVNDLESLMKTGEPRSVNRHNYTRAEIERRIAHPMLQRMYMIMAFRNRYPAFDGECTVDGGDNGGVVGITWHKEGYTARLHADLRTKNYQITYLDDGCMKIL